MSDRRIIYSTDIETTGLDPEYCQILEIGMIAWDLDLPCEPLDRMKRFHCFVKYPVIEGEAFALGMNANIIKRIATPLEGDLVLSPFAVVGAIKNWIIEIQGSDEQGVVHCQFAGKNFGSFDSRFLEELPAWNEYIRASHRSYDPAILYFDSAIDRKLPDMNTCLARAATRTAIRTGVDQGFGLLETRHDAIGDAELVIKLLRAAWGIDEDTKGE